MQRENKDIITVEGIYKNLRGNAKSLKIEVLDCVNSTNDYLKEVAKSNGGAPHGTVIISRKQTGGKGRLGREFFSPDSTGIYMSILLKEFPSGDCIFNLTTFSAVCVANAIEKVSSQKMGIKWVNDIYSNGRKVCGILAEAGTSANSEKPDYIVLGIGINVYEPKGGFPDYIKSKAGAVYPAGKEKKGQFDMITAEVLNVLFERFDEINTGVYMDEYADMSIMVGKNIKIRYLHEETEFSGLVVGIEKNGALNVKLTNVEIREFTAGEISTVL